MHQRSRHIFPSRTTMFVRWSRNPAAVFHSRRMVVNIGQLKANILEQITKKTLPLLLPTGHDDNTTDALCPDEEEEDDLSLLLELMEFNAGTLSSSCVRHQDLTSNHHNKEGYAPGGRVNHHVRWSLGRLSHILFCQ